MQIVTIPKSTRHFIIVSNREKNAVFAHNFI